MALRSLIAFAVVIAIQALAGCHMPAKSGVAREDRSAWRKAEFEARKQFEMRRQIEAGSFGLAQLYPGGKPIDPRNLSPLPRPSAVPIPVVPVRVAQSSTSESRLQLAFGATAAQPDGCFFKPVMSDADIEACR